MKKILSFLLGLGLASGLAIAFAQSTVSGPIFFKYVGTSIVPIRASSILGTSTQAIANAYFTNLNVSGTCTGCGSGGSSTSTFGFITATTTTATSTFAGRISVSGTSTLATTTITRLGIGTTNPVDLLSVVGNQMSIKRDNDSDFIQFTNAANSVEFGRIRTINTAQFGITAVGRSLQLETNSGSVSLWSGTGASTQYVTLTNIGNLNIGTTTALSKLIVVSSGSTTPFTVASSTGVTIFSVDSRSHITSTSNASTSQLTSCGTTPLISGNDRRGFITGGTGSNGCTFSFSVPYSATTTCTVSARTGSIANTFNYTVSTTTLVVTQTGLGTGVVDYDCEEIR